MGNVTKFVRKFTTTLLAILLVSSLSLGVVNAQTELKAGATPEQKVLLRQTVISEYDLYKQFKSKTTEQLKKEGYTSSQIASLEQKDFKSELTERAKLDDTKLKGMGYTENQIQTLRNFTGTEEQLYALSATLESNFFEWGHSSSSSYSYCKLEFNWTWSSVPVWLEEDAVAMVWSNSMYCNSSDSDNTVTLYYYDEWTDEMTRASTKKPTVQTNLGAYCKFDMGYHNNDTGGEWVKTGAMDLTVFKQAKVTDFSANASYGHTQLAMSPSVSFASTPSLSITFSWYCNKEVEEDVYVNLAD